MADRISTGSPGRREDERLVTGRGRFAADRRMDGELHAVFLRSDRAHAEIRALDVAAARTAPGVVAVFTGEDARAQGAKAPPNRLPVPGRDGERIRQTEQFALAPDRVRFVGEAVALVVAESEAAAHDAIDRITVDYRDLPVAADLDAALAPGAPLLHAAIPGNLALLRDVGEEAATTAAFAGAAHVVRLAVHSQKLIPAPLEPRACLVRPLGDGRFEVVCPSQGAAILHSDLAAFAGLPPDRVTCLAEDVGGSFGARAAATPDIAAVLMAARCLGRPVRWQGSRSETFVTDCHGRGIRLDGELALDREGRFLALRASIDADLGAYLHPAGPLISGLNPTLTLTGTYRIPAAFATTRLVLTNTAPVGPYRGAGRPDIAYLVERLVDVAAAETGLDRVALRRLNLIPREAFPYRTPTAEYCSGDFADLLDTALGEAGWEGFETRRASAATRGRLRGIGVSLFVEPAGGGPLPAEEAAITVLPDGTFRLHALAGASGQGHETVLPAIVAERLGVAPERVALAGPGVDGPPLTGTGTSGSRGMMIHGSALAAAADALVERGRIEAARLLDVLPEAVRFDAGTYRVAGSNRTLTLPELARRLPRNGSHPLDAGATVPVARSYPSGAHVAEVEVDPELGTLEVLAYTAVDDAGRVVDHALLEGQLQGGIAQGAGQVLGEGVVYEPATGQLLTASFLDYWMPRADSLPRPQILERCVPSPTNLLGAKGAGEAGTTGALPALANAVADALKPLGLRDVPLPVTPARLWRLMQDAIAAGPPVGRRQARRRRRGSTETPGRSGS